MMLDDLYPRTKERSCSSDPEDAYQARSKSLMATRQADVRELTKAAKRMSAGSGDVTIILVRS